MRARPAGISLLCVTVFMTAITQARVMRAQSTNDAPVPRVYSASEVDKHAEEIGDGVQPLYPDSLRPLGVEGKVLAQFVVDTTGIVDTTSILTEAYGQPLFAASVRRALATMHFLVAQKSGHKVAEEIEQSFVFHKEVPAAAVGQKGEVARIVDSMAPTGGYIRLRGPAEFAPGSEAPKYPASLIRAHMNAIVYTTFVVDTTGRIDPVTFKVTSVKTWRDGPAPYHDAGGSADIDDVAPGQAFTEAVRVQVPRMRFVPARVNGRNVRQLATQPFTFTMLP